MFWGIVTSALSAINTIVYKKLLLLNAKNGISSMGLYGYMCLLVVVMVEIFHFLSPTYVPLDFSVVTAFPWIIPGILAFSVLGIIASVLSQYAYKNEKMSVLTPFGEAGRIMTMILGFVLFTTTSHTAFAFALVSATTLVLSSIDFRAFSMNKYCLVILLVGLIQSVNTLIAGYTIAHLSSFSFILVDNITITLLVLIFMLVFERSTLVRIPKQTTLPLVSALSLNNLLWIVSYTITLYLMKELGIVMTSLLGMFTMVLTIVSGYVFFRDIPTRKDVIVASIIVCSIIGGSVL